MSLFFITNIISFNSNGIDIETNNSNTVIDEMNNKENESNRLNYTSFEQVESVYLSNAFVILISSLAWNGIN